MTSFYIIPGPKLIQVKCQYFKKVPLESFDLFPGFMRGSSRICIIVLRLRHLNAQGQQKQRPFQQMRTLNQFLFKSLREVMKFQLFLLRNMNSGVFSEMGRSQGMHPHDFSHMMSSFEYMPLRPMGMQSRPVESYNQHQMKLLVDEMRFKEKMDVINKKKGKYKRSTNNCHKKYIGILKNLVCLKLNNELKDQMLERFFQYRNSRVYYFIILSFLKWYLSPGDIRWVFEHFVMEVSNKIQRYRMEINLTSNSNFVHFRKDQILEMEFSIDAIYNFLRGRQEEAMKILYQKNKYIIIKKNQYLKTLQIIKDLREELEVKTNGLNIFKKEQDLQIEEVYHWRQPSFNSMNEFHMPPVEREYPFEKGYEPYEREVKEVRMKEEKVSEREESESYFNPNEVKPNHQADVMVKQEEKMGESQKKFPLIGLENSYPVIDFMSWHSWLIQKQKSLQFYIKSKEETMSISKPLQEQSSPWKVRP